MICCEKCEAWQHNECMEVSENDEDLPDKYYCEQCRPKDHKTLLAKIARGEKPWEERAKEREREEEEKRARKGKGKKGKKARPSAAKKEDIETNGAGNAEVDVEAESSQINETAEAAPEDSLDSPQVESNKRKLPEEVEREAKSPSQAVCHPGVIYEDSLTVHQEPASKLRKVSSPAKPLIPPPSRRKSNGPATSTKRDSNAMILQTELVENISDLQSDDRKRIATALYKLFVGQTKQAEKDGSFSLPEGQSVDEYGLKLGLAVEYAVYLNFWGSTGKPSDQYGDKFRAINHNIKANPSLRDRLLTGELSPNDFSKMSREDMASKELQEKKAEMLKEAEKQHMIIHEEGPRIRRTHKGEELVDDETHIADGADSAFSAPIRKRPSEIDTTMKDASPEAASPQSPSAVELPESITARSPGTDQPLTVDTKAPPLPSAAGDRKSSSSAFDIQQVWSGVKGPDLDAQRMRQTPRQSESAAPPVQQQADAEIDQLLKDEEPEDEEPYSPAEFAVEPGSAIWHGKMGMAGIASFNGKAKHVAGADLSSNMQWSQLIPTALTIEGRIDIDRASDYLCGLRYSHTTDVVVVSMTPNENPEDTTQFEKLFRYFTERRRYGVIGKNPNTTVKDTYVVPLDVNTSQKPEFIALLDHCAIEDPTLERMLLLTFVVKSNNSPSAQQTPRHLDASSVASPIGASGNQPTPMGQHPGFQTSPTPAMPFAPPQQFPYNGSPQQTGYVPPHGQHHSPYPPPPQHHFPGGPTGMEAARQALGDLANAPAVQQLIAETPGLGYQEYLSMKQLLENVEICRTDVGILKGSIQAKKQQEQGQAGQ